MKKLLNYILLVLFIVTLLAGCTKHMLDQNPTSDIGSSTFWKSQNDADLALAGIYSYFIQGYNYTASGNTGQGFGAGTPYWETLADNAYSSAYSNIAQGAITSTVGGLQTDAYTTSYRAIQACNTFLDNVGKIDLPAATLTQYRAQVKFARAYWYFLLTQLYGDVVLTTHQITLAQDNSMKARTPKAIVIDTILNDLNYAASNLPNIAYNGHAVRGSALGYIARVYLAQHQYQQAATAANTIISEGKFSIYTGGYRNLFLKPGQNGNPEIIFSGRYQVPTAYSPADYLYTYSASFQPLNYLVNDYECKDGLPITASPLYNPASPYTNRDPRLLATILTPGVLYKGGIPFVPSQIAATAGFLNKKGVDSTRATVIGTQSDQDWVYLRYADVLLMYAEALNENGKTDQALTYLNQVRTRAKMPAYTTMTKDQLRTKIYDERVYELSMEGVRWFDLARTGRLDAVMGPLGYKPFNALFPIPLVEIQIINNPSILPQNPGYS